MLKSSLCHTSDAYIFVKGNIIVANTAAKYKKQETTSLQK